MKKGASILTVILFIITHSNLSAQTIDFSTVPKGIILPVLDITGLTGLAEGTILFYSGVSCLYVYDGALMQKVAFAGQIDQISDADNTKIEVEKNVDGSIIRFTIDGNVSYTFLPNRLQLPSSSANLFIGNVSGQSITTGFRNTAIGEESGGP